MSKIIKVKELSSLLRRLGVEKEKRKEILKEARGNKLPCISKRQIRRMKLDLAMYGIAGLSFGKTNPDCGKVRRIHPQRINLKSQQKRSLNSQKLAKISKD